jgi:hypothetical protein
MSCPPPPLSCIIRPTAPSSASATAQLICTDSLHTLASAFPRFSEEHETEGHRWRLTSYSLALHSAVAAFCAEMRTAVWSAPHRWSHRRPPPRALSMAARSA